MSTVPVKPPVGRRLFFLGMCIFGYAVLMGGWWLSQHAGTNGPPMPVVTLLIQPFAPATPDVTTPAQQLTAELPNAFANVAGLKVITTGMAETATAVLNGTVSGTAGNLKIAANLTGPRGTPIWAKTYAATQAAPTSLSRDMASDVLAALRKTIH